MPTSSPPPSIPAASAIVVAYDPGPSLVDCVASIVKQVEHVYIIDNSDESFSRHIISQALALDRRRVSVHENRTNLGIATALNQGFRMAEDAGYSFVLSLDQDSKANPDMASKLIRVWHKMRDREMVAIVAPEVIDIKVRRRSTYLRPRYPAIFERAPCEEEVLRDVSIVMSSGALFSLSAFRNIGPFREDLFIDYVDTEYCLRARQAGYDIIVACDAQLNHRWGNARAVNFMGATIRPTFHSPLRWYYISRNRIPTIRNHGQRFPHWLLFDLIMAVWWIVRMLLFEDLRLRKVRAVILGTWDGVRARLGPCQRTI